MIGTVSKVQKMDCGSIGCLHLIKVLSSKMLTTLIMSWTVKKKE